MNGFRSDIDGLRRCADEFDDLAARADRIAEDLRRAVEATGRCWGSDEIGAEFAAAHQEPAERALTAVAGLAPELRALGGRFAETAAEQRRVDGENSARLSWSGGGARSGDRATGQG